MTEPAELHAWKPWQECLGAFRYMASLESPGDLEHWKIYWVGTLTLLRTIRDVLDRIDVKKSKLHAKIVHDFAKSLSANRNLHPIYWEFVCRERDNLVHEYSLAATEHRVTTSTMMDRDLAYDQLVEKYGERKMLTWGHDGEDALRLLELAIEWWELNLRVIEQAVREQEPSPFSQGYRRWHDLANASFQFRKSFSYDWSRGSAQPSRLAAET